MVSGFVGPLSGLAGFVGFLAESDVAAGRDARAESTAAGRGFGVSADELSRLVALRVALSRAAGAVDSGRAFTESRPFTESPASTRCCCASARSRAVSAAAAARAARM